MKESGREFCWVLIVGTAKNRKGFDRTVEACFCTVQVGMLTSAGQEMQVMAGTRLLPHIAAE